MLLAICEYPCSRAPASIILDERQLPLQSSRAQRHIWRADFFAEGALAHKALLGQKLDKGSLHNDPGAPRRTPYWQEQSVHNCSLASDENEPSSPHILAPGPRALPALPSMSRSLRRLPEMQGSHA